MAMSTTEILETCKGVINQQREGMTGLAQTMMDVLLHEIDGAIERGGNNPANVEPPNAIIRKDFYSLRAVFAAMQDLEITYHGSTNPAVKVKVESDEVTCKLYLLIEMSRPAYNSTGYHEGSEVCVFMLPILDHASVFEDTSNIMFDIDPCIVDFNNAKIADMWSPEEYGDEEGYFPPGEDFWWDEFTNMVANPVVKALESGKYRYVFSKKHPQDDSDGRFWLFSGDEDFVYNLDAPDPCGARENLLYTELP